MANDVSDNKPNTKYMIVEDHPLFRNLLRTVLSGPDSEVIEVSNGEDALKAYDVHMPDWVIMDIEMPLLDGLATTRHIKAIHPEARIVIVTQYVQDSYREEAEDIGAELFVSKDNVVHLKETLNQLTQS